VQKNEWGPEKEASGGLKNSTPALGHFLDFVTKIMHFKAYFS